MSEYGLPPAADVLELTIFGPGHGEAIAVHLGEGEWLLIDSCLNPATHEPATATYLDHMLVKAGNVRAIVASHWHDDHVRGISSLAQKYPDAEFTMSAALNSEEATAFLAAYSGANAPGLARGTTELYSVVDQKEGSVFCALHKTNVLEVVANSQNIRVTALSPTKNTFAKSTAHLAQYLPRLPGQDPISHAPEPKQNLEAIVIHIDFGGGDAMLLGADLESHAKFGWAELVVDKWCLMRQQASVYKVAHHGSKTGDHPAIWSGLLRPGVVACMTPFNRSKLPTQADKRRIKLNALAAYITSAASQRPKVAGDQLKRLKDICNNLTPVNSGFGAVRLRKKIGEQEWKVELFGNAKAL